MKYRILQPFTGNGKMYMRGDILDENEVSCWKNLNVLVVTGYLDPIVETADEVRNVPERVIRPRKTEKHNNRER